MNYLQKKKLAFMSIVNSVKGFIRTVFGVPPLSLPDCVDTYSIINYSIVGNSVQNGTPTPDTPIEVESVGEYDEEMGKYKIPVVCSDENGSSTTTNIYLDEPLRKIGDYVDYIDFENQKVVRNIRYLKWTNSQSWIYVNDGEQYVFRYTMSENNSALDSPSSKIIWSNVAEPKSRYEIYNSANNVGVSVSSTSIRMSTSIWDSVLSELSAIAFKQYISENDCYCIYVLATPRETPITLPKLPTIKGTTVYTIGTTVQPTNMSATYYATSKE